MLTGFRVAGDDFVGARQRWKLPPGTAPLGRVFPDKQPMRSASVLSPLDLVRLIDAKAERVRQAGMIPFISFKPPIGDTLGGEFDNHLAAVGRWCAEQPQGAFATVWHEPQNDLMGALDTDYAQRARNFVEVYQRCWTVMKSMAGDRLRMGPVDMAYKWLPGTAATADGAVSEAWRVPADAMDFRGLDIYSALWSWDKGRAVAEKADYLRWRAWLGDDSKILLVERGIANNTAGSDPGGDQAHTLAADYVHLASIGAQGLMYWHSTGATDASQFGLSTAAAAVFRQIAALAAAGQGGGAQLPGEFERGRLAAYDDMARYADLRAGAAKTALARR